MYRTAAAAFALLPPAVALAAGFAYLGGLVMQFGGAVDVPNVIGSANSTAADMTLEAVGLDLGTVTARCSDEPLNEVVGQEPAPGTGVDLGTLVNVLVSNGVECPNAGRPGVRLRGLRLPGL